MQIFPYWRNILKVSNYQLNQFLSSPYFFWIPYNLNLSYSFYPSFYHLFPLHAPFNAFRFFLCFFFSFFLFLFFSKHSNHSLYWWFFFSSDTRMHFHNITLRYKNVWVCAIIFSFLFLFEHWNSIIFSFHHLFSFHTSVYLNRGDCMFVFGSYCITCIHRL